MNGTQLTQKNEIKILQNTSVKKSREKINSKIQTEWRMERHSVVARCREYRAATNYTQAIYQSKYQIYHLCLLFIGVTLAFSICNTHRSASACAVPMRRRRRAVCEPLNKWISVFGGRIQIFIFNWDLFWCFVVYSRCVAGRGRHAHTTYHITIDSESTESWPHFHFSVDKFCMVVLLCWCTAPTTVAHSQLSRASFVYKILMSFDIPMRLCEQPFADPFLYIASSSEHTQLRTRSHFTFSFHMLSVLMRNDRNRMSKRERKKNCKCESCSSWKTLICFCCCFVAYIFVCFRAAVDFIYMSRASLYQAIEKWSALIIIIGRMEKLNLNENVKFLTFT